jgi:hypothetical protein
MVVVVVVVASGTILFVPLGFSLLLRRLVRRSYVIIKTTPFANPFQYGLSRMQVSEVIP